MQCPACPTQKLKPLQLEYGLPGSGCDGCKGVLVSLISYRLWQERFQKEQSDETVRDSELASDSKSVLLCPKCSRLMLKYKYTVERDASIDLCSHCDEIWLDGDEWQRLKALRITGELTAVFTEPWQRDLQEKRSKKAGDELWARRLGDDLQPAKDFRAWLRERPQKQFILNYLMQDDD